MKILLTSDLFAPSVNGVVVSFMNLYNELKNMGHDVRILTLSKEDNSYVEGDVYFIRSFGLKIYPHVRGTLAFNTRILNKIIDWKPDIIHSQCEFFTYGFAYRIARKVNCPLVHTYHTLYEYYTKYLLPIEGLSHSLVSNVMRHRLRNADLIIAPTDKVKRTLDSYELNEKIIIIPTGINLDKYDHPISQEEKNSLKESLSIPLENKLLINLGRVAEEKNLKELLIAFKKLEERNKNVSFMIVGDGPYMKELKEEIHTLNLEDKVKLTGMIKPDYVARYYQTADIFVSASVSETQGLTYIEALANSLPEIARRDDCLEGVLIHDYNGYIYDTIDQFVDYAEKLINSEEKLKEFSKNANEVSKLYSTKNFGKNVFAAYKEVLKNFAPSNRPMSFENISREIKITSARIIKAIEGKDQ